MNFGPVTLSGRLVRLEPLGPDHVADLAEAGRDESIWRLMPYGSIVTEERMAAFVDEILELQANGTEFAFAVVLLETGRAVGCTRYLEIRRRHRGLEIGGTWYGVAQQRTGVNTECKSLLLRHAFEVLGCLRVQLKTDLRNVRSQRAIERIGGVREGIFGQHVTMPDGYQRSSVVYSILDDEWPGVKVRLEHLMRDRDTGQAAGHDGPSAKGEEARPG